MSAIDLTPLYRTSIGFDRLASFIESALSSETVASSYPPYNIEMLDENRYAITLAVAGFEHSELDVNVEKSVLSICGKKASEAERNYLHQDIANSIFERKFNLADYISVTDADLKNGLLTINLVKEIPEVMKPKPITINQSSNVLEHHDVNEKTESESNQAA